MSGRCGLRDTPSLHDPEARAAINGVGFQWAANALFLRNADGCEAAVVQNPLTHGVQVSVAIAGGVQSVTLAPKSFTTLA